jgi:hypothetical protein
MAAVTTVVISPYRTVKFLEGGGHFWVYLQYVHGLRQIGCDVYWLEHFSEHHAGPGRSRVAALLERLQRYGLGDRGLLYTYTNAGGGEPEFVGTTRQAADEVFARADLLLNFHYAMDPGLLARFRRTALVDIDPGLLQMWISTGQVHVAPHDVYLTTGETVGTPAARFPDCGLRWRHIRPPVALDLWPYAFDPRAEAFTTVTNWWGGWAPDIVDGRPVLYDNNKRVSYRAFAELGRLTSQPLELAVHLADSDGDDRRLLERHGWRIRHSSEVSSTPEGYQHYIQHSRGEISCVKPSCIKLQNAWISDRSLCYLASGKPVVVQDTGPSSYLPVGEGLLHFSTPREAAEALATVNADYEKHCRAARELAKTHFDARRIAERILDLALA